MHTQKKQIRQHSLRLALVAGCAALFSPSNTALGADGTWILNNNGNWSTPGNWTGGIVADGAGDTATFNTLNLTGGNRTVTIDTTSRTIGRFLIGDSNSGSNNRRSYIIAASGGATLTFDNGGSDAVVTQRNTSNGDIFSTPIILNDSLDITNASATQRLQFTTGGITAGDAGTKTITILGTAGGDVTMSGIIAPGAGDIAIVKGNANNELVLSGANSFAGGVTLNAGLLLLNNATALGTGTLTITGGSIGGNTTMTTDNVQNWNGDFGFGGTGSLNLGTGAVTMSASRTITIGSTNDTLTVGGIISGAGFSLSTANATGVATGILALTGANTYDGGTNINGGVVRFDSGAIPATGSITIQTGGALSVSGAHTSLAGWLANPALSNTATGALSLAGDNSENFDPGAAGFNTVSLGANVGANVDYTGTLTPSGSGYFVGGGGGTINFLNAGAFTGASTLTAGNGGGGTVVIAEDNATYSGNVTIANGTLQIGAGGSVGSLGTTTSVVNNGTLVLNRSDNQALSFAISGTGSLNHLGTGVTTLNAVNSYGGNTTVANGTLVLGVAGAVPNGAALTLGAPTTAGNLDLNGFDLTVTTLTSLSSNGANTSTVTITPGQTLTVTGNATFGRLATGVMNNTTFTGGGTLALTGTGSTLQIGVETSTTANVPPVSFATLDLTGLGSFTTDIANFNAVFAQMSGATTLLSNTSNNIKATTIRVGHSDANNPGATSTLTFGTGTNVVQADSIQISIDKSSGTVNFASQAPLSPGTVTITDRAGTGAANFIIASSEATNTANSFSGVLDLRGHSANVTAGTMQIGKRNDTSSGDATGTVSFDTGTFTATTIDLGNRSSTGANPGSAATGILEIGGGAFTVGTLNMANKSNTSTGSAVGTVNVSGGTFTVNTLFSLATQAGSGTSTGNLNITGGTVTSNVDITDGGGATTTSVTLDGGTLDLTGKNLGDLANPIDTLNFRSGTLNNVAAINGTGGLTKTTAGLLTLGGASTYTGATSVDAGTLRVNGSITSAVTVLAGTLDGTGDGLTTGLIGAPVVIGDSTGTGDAILAPGNSIGTLTATGALTFNSDALFAVELNSDSSLTDLMVANGVNIDPLASISFADLGSSTFAPGSYTLIDNTSGTPITGVFSNLADGASLLIGANNFVASYSGGTGNDLVLNVAAIPEPSTLVLGGLALLGFTGAALRKRRLATQTV